MVDPGLVKYLSSKKTLKQSEKLHRYNVKIKKLKADIGQFKERIHAVQEKKHQLKLSRIGCLQRVRKLKENRKSKKRKRLIRRYRRKSWRLHKKIQRISHNIKQRLIELEAMVERLNKLLKAKQKYVKALIARARRYMRKRRKQRVIIKASTGDADKATSLTDGDNETYDKKATKKRRIRGKNKKQKGAGDFNDSSDDSKDRAFLKHHFNAERRNVLDTYNAMQKMQEAETEVIFKRKAQQQQRTSRAKGRPSFSKSRVSKVRESSSDVSKIRSSVSRRNWPSEDSASSRARGRSSSKALRKSKIRSSVSGRNWTSEYSASSRGRGRSSNKALRNSKNRSSVSATNWRTSEYSASSRAKDRSSSKAFRKPSSEDSKIRSSVSRMDFDWPSEDSAFSGRSSSKARGSKVRKPSSDASKIRGSVSRMNLDLHSEDSASSRAKGRSSSKARVSKVRKPSSDVSKIRSSVSRMNLSSEDSASSRGKGRSSNKALRKPRYEDSKTRSSGSKINFDWASEDPADNTRKSKRSDTRLQFHKDSKHRQSVAKHIAFISGDRMQRPKHHHPNLELDRRRSSLWREPFQQTQNKNYVSSSSDENDAIDDELWWINRNRLKLGTIHFQTTVTGSALANKEAVSHKNRHLSDFLEPIKLNQARSEPEDGKHKTTNRKQVSYDLSEMDTALLSYTYRDGTSQSNLPCVVWRPTLDTSLNDSKAKIKKRKKKKARISATPTSKSSPNICMACGMECEPGKTVAPCCIWKMHEQPKKGGKM